MDRLYFTLSTAPPQWKNKASDPFDALSSLDKKTDSIMRRASLYNQQSVALSACQVYAGWKRNIPWVIIIKPCNFPLTAYSGFQQ